MDQPEGSRSYKAAVVGAGGGAHFVHDGIGNTLYLMFPLWSETFGLSLAQVGMLKMVYSGVMAGFQVPAGFLAERIGERRLLVVGTLLTGAGFLALGWAGGFGGLLLCLALAGLGSAPQHPLASSVISRAFPTTGRRAALGAYNFLGDVGKIAVPAVFAGGLAWIGWQDGVLALGVAGIVAALVLHVVLGNLNLGARPVRARVSADATATATDSGSDSETPGWGIRDRRGFTALSAIGMVDTGARAAFLTFVPFLLIEKGASAETVGIGLVLVLTGGAAGKLACGLIAERLGIIRTVLVTELATVVGMAALIVLPYGAALALLPFLGLALNGTSSVLYGTLGDFVDPERQSRAFGVFYTISIGASSISPFVFGAFGDVFGVAMAVLALAALVAVTIPLCLPLSRSLATVDAAGAQPA